MGGCVACRVIEHMLELYRAAERKLFVSLVAYVETGPEIYSYSYKVL